METEQISLAELASDPENANRGTVAGQAALAASLAECGAGRSVLVDAAGRIIAGNKTVAAALAAGIPGRVIRTNGSELVVVQRTDLDLSEPRARKMAYADNAVAALDLEWNLDRLSRDLERGLDLSGLFAPEFLHSLDPFTGEFPDPPPPATPLPPERRTGEATATAAGGNERREKPPAPSIGAGDTGWAQVLRDGQLWAITGGLLFHGTAATLPAALETARATLSPPHLWAWIEEPSFSGERALALHARGWAEYLQETAAGGPGPLFLALGGDEALNVVQETSETVHWRKMATAVLDGGEPLVAFFGVLRARGVAPPPNLNPHLQAFRRALSAGPAGSVRPERRSGTANEPARWRFDPAMFSRAFAEAPATWRIALAVSGPSCDSLGVPALSQAFGRLLLVAGTDREAAQILGAAGLSGPTLLA